MQNAEMHSLIYNEIRDTLLSIVPDEIDALADACLNARKIMVVGKGRVEISLKAFAVRLSDLGFECCAMNSITGFHMDSRDLLIIGNSNGRAGWADGYLEKAHELGAKVFYITSVDGYVSKKADSVLKIKARTMGVEDYENFPSVQPMCSTGEQCILFALDAVALILEARTKQTESDLRRRCSKI